MRCLSFRTLLCVAVVAAAATASLFAVGVGRREPPQRYMNVGGVNNPCTCTQRLER